MPRLPFSYDYNSRDPASPTNNVDARRLNTMDEPKGDGQGVYTMKRPGFNISSSLAGGLGQGVTSFNGVDYAIISDVFYINSPPNSGTDAVSFTANTTPPWVTRSQCGLVVLGDTMYVLGGIGGIIGSAQTPADVWSTRDQINWRLNTSAAPWGTRFGFGCVVFNGLIWVIGGSIGQAGFSPSNDVWSSPDGTEWTQVTAHAAFDPRGQFVCLAVNNGIYVIGGVGLGNMFDDVWFSSDGVSWNRVTPAGGGAPWGKRYDMAGAYYNNFLLIWGGANTVGPAQFRDAWKSIDGGVTWTQTTSTAFPANRAGQGACVYNNKVWSFGGWNNSVTQNSEVYSTSDGVTWTLVTTTPGWNARVYPAVTVFRTPTQVSPAHFQTIIVVGGGGPISGRQDCWRGNLDIALNASQAMPSVPVASQYYQMTSFSAGTLLLIKNQSALWLYGNGGITKVTDVGYPVTTVPGIVVLGAAAYVMDPTGLIYNCPVDDPFHWPSLNVIGADYDDDFGVAIAKYMGFLVAFGTYTAQFFYDAGNPTGSPLAPYPNADIKIGCVDANSVVEIGNTIAWVGQTKQGRRQVYVFDGLSAVPISTPYIEDLIGFKSQTFGSTPAFGISFGSHLWYVLPYQDGAPTFVYDFMTKKWFEWILGAGAGGGSMSSFIGPTTGTEFSAPKLLHGGAGVLVNMNNNARDFGFAFPVTVISTKIDNDNNKNKFWGQLVLIADNPRSSCTPTISFSDDDYVTWSTGRTIDLNTPRPCLYRNGSARRRALRFDLTDTNIIRIEGWELDAEQGS